MVKDNTLALFNFGTLPLEVHTFVILSPLLVGITYNECNAKICQICCMGFFPAGRKLKGKQSSRWDYYRDKLLRQMATSVFAQFSSTAQKLWRSRDM